MKSNGAGEAKTDAHLSKLNYPHDIIQFSGSLIKTNFPEFLRLYEKGLSLNEIAKETGFSKTSIRDLFLEQKVVLRSNTKANPDQPKKPQRAFWGAIPYGFSLLDGKLIVDGKETKVVRRILNLHQKGMSFNAIAKTLSAENIPSKIGKKWSDKTIAAIIRRTKTE